MVNFKKNIAIFGPLIYTTSQKLGKIKILSLKESALYLKK